uniref:Uncharacterized protein n=1 Tax=Anguilla anguilla TaxID=7936 RepID=A0A0E9RWM7_ANGAN
MAPMPLSSSVSQISVLYPPVWVITVPELYLLWHSNIPQRTVQDSIVTRYWTVLALC